MRYIAAACLTALAGKEVNADNIEKILRYSLVIPGLFILFAFNNISSKLLLKSLFLNQNH
jgi:hypothetical protein